MKMALREEKRQESIQNIRQEMAKMEQSIKNSSKATSHRNIDDFTEKLKEKQIKLIDAMKKRQ